jgi:hypothetical protein
MDFLWSKLDFEIGMDFEKNILRSTGRCIHDSVCNDSGFHLLATFRRYLFQLNEDSVAIALQSCLGGLAQHYCVSFQSHNHFRFTVYCKKVGFAIYKLRRFIGASFDVYFHLWSSGAPHWDREKRLWEAGEAKKWEKVMSRNKKRLMSKSSRSPRKHTKKVHFADKLILDSPVVKSIPSVKPSTIKFGSFVFDLHSEAETARSTHERCGILKKPGFLPDDEVFFHKEGNTTHLLSSDCSKAQGSGNVSPPEGSRFFPNPNCSGNDSSPLEDSRSFLKPNCFTANRNIKTPVHLEVIDIARRLGKCTRCFSFNHRRMDCCAPFRCAACFKFGHVFKFFSTVARPKIYWRPKSTHVLRPRKETQQSLVEDDESGVNSVSPPIYSASVENPNINGELTPPLDPEAPRPSSTEALGGKTTEEMANFEVDPTPFVPEGMNVEDWARPARGRIIITTNPPHRHE